VRNATSPCLISHSAWFHGIWPFGSGVMAGLDVAAQPAAQQSRRPHATRWCSIGFIVHSSRCPGGRKRPFWRRHVPGRIGAGTGDSAAICVPVSFPHHAGRTNAGVAWRRIQREFRGHVSLRHGRRHPEGHQQARKTRNTPNRHNPLPCLPLRHPKIRTFFQPPKYQPISQISPVNHPI
jgi:hypothetical protein